MAGVVDNKKSSNGGNRLSLGINISDKNLYPNFNRKLEVRQMNKIKELRKEQSKSLEEVAEAVGVSRATLNNWENEAHEPTKEQWEALAKFFDVTPGYLIGWSYRRFKFNSEAPHGKRPKVFHPETNIGLLRQEHNLTMDEFMRKVTDGNKRSGAILTRIEADGQKPSKEFAEKVAKAFNVNEAFAMGWTNNRDPHLLDDVEETK